MPKPLVPTQQSSKSVVAPVTPTKKKSPLLMIVMVIVVLVVLSRIGKGFSKEGATSFLSGTADQLSSNSDYREQKAFTLNPSSFPQVGDTEADVYRIYGPNIERRLSYKTPRQKTINGQQFSFDKLINYTYYLYVRTKLDNNGSYDDTPTERTEAIIYLLNGNVVFQSFRHQVKQGENYVTVEPSSDLDETGQVWPGTMEDIAAYREQ